MLGDKSYDSNVVRYDLERRVIDPVTRPRSNRKVKLTMDTAAYTIRNRIERFFNKTKHSRHVAIHYDKLASSFVVIAEFATFRCWIIFVQTSPVPDRCTGVRLVQNLVPNVAGRAGRPFRRSSKFPFRGARRSGSREHSRKVLDECTSLGGRPASVRKNGVNVDLRE